MTFSDVVGKIILKVNNLACWQQVMERASDLNGLDVIN